MLWLNLPNHRAKEKTQDYVKQSPDKMIYVKM